MKTLKKSVFLCIAAVMLILLCGCSNSDGNKGLTGQYWQSSEYTLDEINAKFHPALSNHERALKENDVSEDALRAYNVMLGYAERILGREYYVYDCYYADWTDPPHSWLIKIVPYGMAQAAESENRNLYVDEPLSLFFDEDGSEVNSTIEMYFMAQSGSPIWNGKCRRAFPNIRSN